MVCNRLLARMPWSLFLLVLVLGVHWVLLLGGLAHQSLWIDEWFTVDIVNGPWASLIPHILQTERRPPLHYTLLKFWASIGDQEYILRVYSVMLSLLSVSLLYALGRRMVDDRTGLLAALLLASSPFLILYGRMVRAYSQTVLLSLLATWGLWLALDKPRPQRWLLYGLSVLMLLYTDYSGLAVLGGHALFVLVQSVSRRQLPVLWLGTMLIVMFGYLPWLPSILAHAKHPVRVTDFATGIVGFLLKLAYPWFSWGAGETIFPWNPAAFGWVVCGLLVLYGLTTLYGERKPAFGLLVGWFIVPLVFTASLLTFVATDIPFLNAASRTPGALPAFYLSAATGLSRLRRSVSLLAALLISGTFATALLNYYQGREFHNPIYAVPIRQIVEEVRKDSGLEDLIIAEPDTLFGYYYNQNPGSALYQDVNCPANKVYIQMYHPTRVWLVTFGRDSTAGTGCAEELAKWLKQIYPTIEIRGYVFQDTVYRWFKELLLRRPAYAYKLLIRVYSDR